MKCMKDFGRNFVLKSDLFAATPTLRYKGGSAYETVVGGCLSIILVICFILIFYNSFINVLYKVNVLSTVDVEVMARLTLG